MIAAVLWTPNCREPWDSLLCVFTKWAQFVLRSQVPSLTVFSNISPKRSVQTDCSFTNTIVLNIQGAYKLSEDFAKPYFHKYWTEIHDVTTIWKRNVRSFIVTLNAFDVRPTCDTADVQTILPFPPNPPKHVLCDVPDCGVDALSQFW